MSVTIKSYYNDAIKRVTTAAPRNVAQLSELLAMQHGLNGASLNITYTDDEGDKITLSTDLDLREALLVARKTNILRLHLQEAQPKNKDKEEEQEHCCQGLPAFLPMLHQARAMLPALVPMALSHLEQNPELKAVINRLLESEQIRVVQPYNCDACSREISGSRYECRACNFDLCTTCMTKFGASAHPHELKTVSQLDAIIGYLEQGGDPSVFLQAYFQEGKASEGAPKAVTHNAICDVCDNGQSITGIRHRCATCPDWDACSLHKDAHEHELHALPTPEHYTAFEETRKAHAIRAARQARKAARKAAQQQRRALEAKLAQEAKAAKLAREEELKKKPKEEELSSFERNLATLAQMGFADRETNIRMLVKSRNSLVDTITELLRGR